MSILYTLVSWVYTRMFAGPKCPDYDDECPTCKAWDNHNNLT